VRYHRIPIAQQQQARSAGGRWVGGVTRSVATSIRVVVVPVEAVVMLETQVEAEEQADAALPEHQQHLIAYP
jgi:hypothetical protein